MQDGVRGGSGGASLRAAQTCGKLSPAVGVAACTQLNHLTRLRRTPACPTPPPLQELQSTLQQEMVEAVEKARQQEAAAHAAEAAAHAAELHALLQQLEAARRQLAEVHVGAGVQSKTGTAPAGDVKGGERGHRGGRPGEAGGRERTRRHRRSSMEQAAAEEAHHHRPRSPQRVSFKDDAQPKTEATAAPKQETAGGAVAEAASQPAAQLPAAAARPIVPAVSGKGETGKQVKQHKGNKAAGSTQEASAGGQENSKRSLWSRLLGKP